MHKDLVITGIGVVAPSGVGRENFWKAQGAGGNFISEVSTFASEKFSVKLAGELKDFDPKTYLGPKGLRNLDRSSLFLMVAAKEALAEARLSNIDDLFTDNIGVCTGTSFSNLWSLIEFDREILKEGLDFANPALFPSTVINAASSWVSIWFNIQGFNTTVSTGYTSGLEALRYSIEAIEAQRAEIVLAGAVDVLSEPLFFGFQRLGYMAGLKGIALCCPFDRRRNGPLLGEAAVVFCVEDIEKAKQRGTNIYVKIKSIASFFDAPKIGKINPEGQGLEIAIKKTLDLANITLDEIDYISSCANSTQDLDRMEIKVLKKIFGQKLRKIPISSIKSMFGETIAASGALQIASCIGAMDKGIIPPTINYQDMDLECDIDCVPNKPQTKDVKIALVVSSGPGGYNSACLLEKYK